MRAVVIAADLAVASPWQTSPAATLRPRELPAPERVKFYRGVPAQYQALFRACEDDSGFPGEIVAAMIGRAENCRWDPLAEGPARSDGTRDQGLFQHHSGYLADHARRFNAGAEYDPFDPFQAAPVTFRLLAANYRELSGNMALTIASYRQGVAGVLVNGPDLAYVGRILDGDL